MSKKFFLIIAAASIFVTLCVTAWYYKYPELTIKTTKELSWRKNIQKKSLLTENTPDQIDKTPDTPNQKNVYQEINELWKHVNSTADVVALLDTEVRENTKRLDQLTKLLAGKHDNVVADGYGTIAELSSKVDKVLKQNEYKENLDFVEKHAHRLSTLPTKPFNKGKKIVHLDLKGGAPRMSYLLQFMTEAKKYGAGAFLMEYEDMFPWSNGLSLIARKTAYSKENIVQILHTASQLDMEVIPLVQTYGHLEFVLKHDQFIALRRKSSDNKSINAARPESVPFIKVMLDQVLALHPDIKWFHIGGDEVYDLQSCDGCNDLQMTSSQIYLHHMIPILKYVRSKRNSKGEPIIPIIWDDMFRSWEVEDIKEITKYAVPMVWSYVDSLSNYGPFPNDMWVRYVQSFQSVFFASAFKGASKPTSDLMEIERRAKNHLEWLKVVPLMEKMNITVHGIALTGWSRFTHTVEMCELLPVGTPSLALCLEVLTSGKYDGDVVKSVSQRLGVDRLIGQTEILNDPSNYTLTVEGDFLGSDVCVIVEKFVKLQLLTKKLKSQDPYQKNVDKILKYHEGFKKVEKTVTEIFPKYFYEDTTKEWIETKIEKQFSQLQKVARIIEDRQNNKNISKQEKVSALDHMEPIILTENDFNRDVVEENELFENTGP